MKIRPICLVLGLFGSGALGACGAEQAAWDMSDGGVDANFGRAPEEYRNYDNVEVDRNRRARIGQVFAGEDDFQTEGSQAVSDGVDLMRGESPELEGRASEDPEYPEEMQLADDWNDWDVPDSQTPEANATSDSHNGGAGEASSDTGTSSPEIVVSEFGEKFAAISEGGVLYLAPTGGVADVPDSQSDGADIEEVPADLCVFEYDKHAEHGVYHRVIKGNTHIICHEVIHQKKGNSFHHQFQKIVRK